MKKDNYLKIAGIWYIIVFVLSNLFFILCEVTPVSLKEYLVLFSVPVVLPIIICILYLPLIIVLYFLFKKIQSRNYRILTAAFGFSLMYIINAFILARFATDDFTVVFHTIFCCLFVFIYFVIGIVAACTPKSWLPIKWEIVITSALVYVFLAINTVLIGLIAILAFD